MIQIKTEADFQKMREAGKVVEKTLLTLEKSVEAGISTLELDEIAKKVRYSVSGAKKVFAASCNRVRLSV